MRYAGIRHARCQSCCVLPKRPGGRVRGVSAGPPTFLGSLSRLLSLTLLLLVVLLLRNVWSVRLLSLHYPPLMWWTPPLMWRAVFPRPGQWALLERRGTKGRLDWSIPL